MKIKKVTIDKSLVIKRVYLILMLSLLCRFTGMSQVVNPVTMPQNNLINIPPTPEASSLFKFIETPVAKYTGIPNISVPIYDIKLRGLVLPMALNYHSDGYRVDEQSSDVGIGWALEAGGQLSCTVFDKPDLGGIGYKSLGTSSVFSFPYDRPLAPDPGGGGAISLHPNADYTTLMNIAGTPSYQFNDGALHQASEHIGPSDTQPDLFYYSMFGQSGKFFYTLDGQTHLIPFSKTKITSNSVHDGYQIQDEKGNTYVFSQSEQINTTSVPFTSYPEFKSNGSTVTNYTFYLTNVYTLQGDTVNLTYNTLPHYTYRNKDSYTRYSRFPNQTSGTQDVQSSVESITEVFNSKQLSDITTNRGHKVHFTYQPCQRLDMPGRYALMKIDVYFNDKVKSFVLNQDYLNLSSYDCSTKVDSNAVKLKLKQVSETGLGNYTFNYYNEYSTFPPRFNDATDHWGYYNGNGGSPFPRDSLNGFLSGADKSPNFNSCVKGTLQKIQYPTGGYTTYNYELNQYTDSSSVPTTTMNGASVYYDANNPSQTVNFTVPLNANASSFPIRYNCVPNQVNPRFAVTLSGPGGTNIPFMTNPSVAAGTNNAISLAPGNYTIKKVQNGVYGNGYFKISWTETVMGPATNHNVNGGGLRIKSIQNFSDASALVPVHTRNFTYLKANTTLSSGHIYNKPSYYYVFIQNQYKPSSSDYSTLVKTTTTYKTQTSQSNMPLSGLQYGNVTYGQVQEYEVDNGNHSNGYTDNYYSFTPNFSLSGGYYPFTPPTNFDWKNGALLKSEIYKNKGAGYVLQKRVTNTYNDNLTPTTGDYMTPVMPNETYAVGLNVLVTQAEYELLTGNQVTFYPAVFDVRAYKLISAWQTLTSSYEENFENGVTNPLTKTIQYSYDNPVHAQLTRTSQTNSDGKQYFNLTTYPNDYDSSTAFISDLVKTNSVATPIEKVGYEQLPDNSINVLNGSITEYLPGGKNQVANVYDLEVNKPILLSTYKFSNASLGNLPNYTSLGSYVKDTHYQLKASIGSYDANLNPTVVTTANGITSGYKWAYTDQNLIAICKNASDHEFFTEDFENSIVSSIVVGQGHTGTKYLSGNFTPNFTPPNSRSYTIQWWSLNGGKWVMNQQPYTVSTSLSGSIDDVRIFPVDAQMTTNTYYPLVGITSSIDPKGFTIYYEYDEIQRLKTIKDQDGNLIKNYTYYIKP